ncbi:sigma-54-dependent Fis family transcriptional regulator, partial [Hansschlegelia beijingensis]
MSAATPRADLMQARRDFFDRHAEPMGVVPPSILRSWRRCVERGFDSHAEPRIEPVGSAALREHHERSERLIRLCRPELEALAGEARDTGSLVILTDGGGLVLDVAEFRAFAGELEAEMKAR